MEILFENFINKILDKIPKSIPKSVIEFGEYMRDFMSNFFKNWIVGTWEINITKPKSKVTQDIITIYYRTASLDHKITFIRIYYKPKDNSILFATFGNNVSPLPEIQNFFNSELDNISQKEEKRKNEHWIDIDNLSEVMNRINLENFEIFKYSKKYNL